jgi:hypothetical protein
MLENRSAGKVDVVLRGAPKLRLDERVADGTLTVPIPDATFGEEVRVALDHQQTANLGTEIEIVATSNSAMSKQLGAVIRLGDGPSFIALGVGKVLIRLGDDGRPFLEPEDPKLTRLLPTQRLLGECAPEALAAAFDDLPPELLYDTMLKAGTTLKSIDRDVTGCRVFTLRLTFEYKLRVCIPDDAYPFAADASVNIASGMVTSSGGMVIRFGDERGNELQLDRISSYGRIDAATGGGISFAFDPGDGCHRIDATCGDVDIPARVTALIDGVSRPVTFGEALPGPDAQRTTYVLGATAHPVVNLGCIRPAYEGLPGVTDDAPRAAWIATVKRVP